MMKLITALVAVAFAFQVQATTWDESEVGDPILPGELCKVNQPMSWGSYIYNWDSKYDQVFWPNTEGMGIWSCEKSGFVALLGDFEGMSATEIKAIKQYLLQHPATETGIKAKLELMEQLYALRDTSSHFKNYLLRLLARWYQQLEDVDKANLYRRSAYAGIRVALQGELDEFTRLEYLYLAANYARQFGDAGASDQFLLELTELTASLKDEKARNFAAYLQELLPDTRRITEGGVLDPTPEAQAQEK